METIRVKPKDGLTVRHPVTGAPMVEGEVERTPQIIRYLKDGDLVLVPKQKKAVKETK